jgi:hypothetical protein
LKNIENERIEKLRKIEYENIRIANLRKEDIAKRKLINNSGNIYIFIYIRMVVSMYK